MSDIQYEEFVNRLHTKFPAMFSGRYGGIACGSGWWPMIENLCGIIQAHIDHSKGKCPQVIVDQVKEKFGTLRFYVQGGDEFTGGAIWFAESMSGQMCEECGAPGKKHGDGWVRTQCDFHLIEKEALKAQHAKENGLEL